MTLTENQIKYGVIDAPGYHGDTITCWGVYDTAEKAQARARDKSLIAVSGSGLEKGKKYFRGPVADLFATGCWVRL